MSAENGSTQERRRLNLKTIQDVPSIGAETVGMELRAIRLQRGETLAQVSEILKIRKELVEAMEHGRLDLLPGQAYAVGFMRSYSDYLGLNTADVVRRYKAELAAQEPEGHFSMPVAEHEQRFSVVSVLIILVCLGAAGFGAWYLATQSGLFADRPLTPGPSVEDAGTTPQPDMVEPAAPPPAPAAAAPVTPEPAPAPPVAIVPPPTEPVPAVPLPGGIVAPGPGEQPQPATGKVMGKGNANARIVFVARRTTFLTIDSGGTLAINRNLEPGDSYRVPRKGGLKMDASDGGGLDVMLDGAFIGHAGADGVPIAGFALSPEAYGAPAEAPESATPPEATPEPAPAAPEPAPATPEPTPATPPATGPD